MDTSTSNQSLYVKHDGSLNLLKTIFLFWGFITVLNAPLIGELGKAMELTLAQSKALSYVFFATYFVMGIPAGLVASRSGFKKGLQIGLIISACSVFPLVAGARNASFELVLAGLIVQGTGFAFLQVSANPYMLFLGKKKHAASRLSMAGAFNSFGTWLAPLLGSLIATMGHPDGVTDIVLIKEYKTELVVLPYVLSSVVFVGMLVLLNFSKLPEIASKNKPTAFANDTRKYVLQYKHVVLGFFAIFFYVGAEVGVFTKLGIFISSHTSDPSLLSSLDYIIPYYWGGAMVGRFVGANALKTMLPSKGLLIASVGAVALTLVSIVTPSQGAMFAILGLGLFNGIMWPVIFDLGTRGLGKFTPWASTILIMGIVGGAVIPLLVNKIAHMEEWGLNWALGIIVICYVFVGYYAKWGHKYPKGTFIGEEEDLA